MATCAFREGEAMGYTTPALCGKHLAAAVIVAYLAARKLPMTAANARDLALRYPQPGLTADELAELCRPMIVSE